MSALLLALGAFVLAVAASALLGPRPTGMETHDEHTPSMDAIALAI
jgi:hypothetical protein